MVVKNGEGSEIVPYSQVHILACHSAMGAEKDKKLPNKRKETITQSTANSMSNGLFTPVPLALKLNSSIPSCSLYLFTFILPFKCWVTSVQIKFKFSSLWALFCIAIIYNDYNLSLPLYLATSFTFHKVHIACKAERIPSWGTQHEGPSTCWPKSKHYQAEIFQSSSCFTPTPTQGSKSSTVGTLISLTYIFAYVITTETIQHQESLHSATRSKYMQGCSRPGANCFSNWLTFLQPWHRVLINEIVDFNNPMQMMLYFIG